MKAIIISIVALASVGAGVSSASAYQLNRQELLQKMGPIQAWGSWGYYTPGQSSTTFYGSNGGYLGSAVTRR